MRVRISAVTHRGLVRDHNEDCLGWAGWAFNGTEPQAISMELDVTEPLVVVVSDGMGGHAAGDDASRMATELLTAPGAYATPTTETVTRMLQHTSDAINDAGEKRPGAAGMGCTVVGLLIRPDGTVLVFNIGDSRCYRVEGQYLAQLSVDHRRAGSNALTQALGGGHRVILDPDYFECPLPPDPGLILCTDGLDDYAEFAAIEQRVLQGGPDLVAGLRDLALAGRGGDNVSVVQVAVVDGGGDGRG